MRSIGGFGGQRKNGGGEGQNSFLQNQGVEKRLFWPKRVHVNVICLDLRYSGGNVRILPPFYR